MFDFFLNVCGFLFGVKIVGNYEITRLQDYEITNYEIEHPSVFSTFGKFCNLVIL
jgi:hypothetical protein